jgi:hypothetical protein
VSRFRSSSPRPLGEFGRGDVELDDAPGAKLRSSPIVASYGCRGCALQCGGGGGGGGGGRGGGGDGGRNSRRVTWDAVSSRRFTVVADCFRSVSNDPSAVAF